MTTPKCFSAKSGFTLIELMVVVTIIAILAALIVPALQSAQAKSMTLNCMARARSIAGAIRTYASNWDGWTNPDADGYVKSFGYRLRTEGGYFGETGAVPGNAGWAGTSTTASYAYSLKVKDFRCPVDQAPSQTSHVIPTSYLVTSAFAGQNIMNLTGEANRTLVVKERGGKRHPSEGETVDRNYVFADLSTSLGYKGPVLPGMTIRVWNLSTPSGIQGVAQSSVPSPVFETMLSGDLSLNYDWTLMLVGKLDATKPVPNDWNSTSPPTAVVQTWWGGVYEVYPMRNVVARLDGMIKFPATGTWDFIAYGNPSNYVTTFGIGSPSPSPRALYDTTTFTWITRPYWNWNSPWAAPTVVNDTSAYYPLQGVYQGYPDRSSYWNLYWRRLDTATNQYDPNYGGAAGQVVPAQYISTLP